VQHASPGDAVPRISPVDAGACPVGPVGCL